MDINAFTPNLSFPAKAGFRKASTYFSNGMDPEPCLRKNATAGRRTSHRDARRDVGTLRIDVHRSRLRDHDQIHVLHRYGAEQYPITQHQRTCESRPVLELDLDRADIRNESL